MRKLVIMRGHQGAGKSSFIKNLGLESHAVSLDAIRRLIEGPVFQSGRMATSHRQEDRVFSTYLGILRERMDRGELLVLDATHPKASDFKYIQRLVKEFRYKAVCMDFSVQPIEIALKQNLEREEAFQVPDHVIKKVYGQAAGHIIPSEINRIIWREDGSHERRLVEWLAEKQVDLTGYQKIHHIGDIQGCFEPLAGNDGFIPNGLRDDEFYIFTGDILDRGLENDKVFGFFMEKIVPAPNALILLGNHDEYIVQWAQNKKARSGEFRLRTLPQLLAAGFVPEDAERIAEKMHDCLFYHYHGKKVMVTHAGLGCVPDRPERIPSKQYSGSIGKFTEAVDRIFEAKAPLDWYQVHGHRNPDAVMLEDFSRSFNLEDSVENGGTLRVLTLTKDGFSWQSFNNSSYRSMRERYDAGEWRWMGAYYPDWVLEEGFSDRIEPEFLNELFESDLVRTGQGQDRPYITTFNFTRDAFDSRQWTDLSIKARGLFVDVERGCYVARSYEKSFQIDEFEDTRLDRLKDRLKFPVIGYEKENGYLGILGYDARSDELMFSSRMREGTKMGKLFEEITCDVMSAGKIEFLKRYLRDVKATAVFEVIDPVNDPHIIEYSEARIVLLDVIRNSSRFEKLDYDKLCNLANYLGVPVKRRMLEIHNMTQLAGFVKAASDRKWSFNGNMIEGVMFEDQSGYMFKMKTGFYAFWKSMRSLKDRVLRVRGAQAPLKRSTKNPVAAAFYDWCMEQPDSVLSKSVIELRNSFEAGVSYEDFEEDKGPSRDVIGFEYALNALASLGEIKASSADRLVHRAIANDDLLDVLRNSQHCRTIVLAASDSDDKYTASDMLGLDLDRYDAA